jgi:hypothetical protein
MVCETSFVRVIYYSLARGLPRIHIMYPLALLVAPTAVKPLLSTTTTPCINTSNITVLICLALCHTLEPLTLSFDCVCTSILCILPALLNDNFKVWDPDSGACVTTTARVKLQMNFSSFLVIPVPCLRIVDSGWNMRAIGCIFTRRFGGQGGRSTIAVPFLVLGVFSGCCFPTLLAPSAIFVYLSTKIRIRCNL